MKTIIILNNNGTGRYFKIAIIGLLFFELPLALKFVKRFCLDRLLVDARL